MRRVSSIILFSTVCMTSLQSQDIVRIREFADQQFQKGNLSSALKEYQRVLFFDAGNEFEHVYSDIADIYFKQGNYQQALVYYDFARKAVPDDSLSLEYSFNRIKCNFRQDNYLMALSGLYGLPAELSPYFEAKKDLYYAICHFGLNETEESVEYFSRIVDSTGADRIETLMKAYQKVRKKYDPDRLEIMSIFLPGLGQLVAGDVKNGLNSLFLLGGIAAYSFHTMRIYGILDGTLVLVTWFYRYYTGGHKKAHELGAARIREQQRMTYRKIMETVASHRVHGPSSQGSL
ncbi:MAG: tetratricopeptide repeat protein [Bacteroidales bacterium]